MSDSLCPCCGAPVEVDPMIRVRQNVTPQMACVIERLMRGGVVSTDDLLDWMYRDDPDGGPETADLVLKAQLSKQRHRIAASGFRIENVWGQGYVLERVEA